MQFDLITSPSVSLLFIVGDIAVLALTVGMLDSIAKFRN